MEVASANYLVNYKAFTPKSQVLGLHGQAQRSFTRDQCMRQTHCSELQDTGGIIAELIGGFWRVLVGTSSLCCFATSRLCRER
mmetsp:Transcript_27174/g.82428  ORF Transcript_27174/g.82428 Transcript_27174/m.82428 type:complete len:83 (+) Transcript_27174:206-454(+)